MSKRTLKGLFKSREEHTYLHISPIEVWDDFVKQCEAEGLTWADGRKLSEVDRDDVVALTDNMTFCYIGICGRIAIQCRPGNLKYIDYKKYVNGNISYLISNNHPAIVSREVFQAVQSEMARRTSKHKISDLNITEQAKYSGKYALSEKLYCGDCGSAYRRRVWVRKDGNKVVWRCISRLEHGSQYCHSSITVEESKLHQAICNALNQVASVKDKAFDLLSANLMYAVTGDNKVLDAYSIEQSIERVKAEMDNAVEKCAKTEGDVSRFLEGISQLNQQLIALREQLEIAKKQSAASEAVCADVERIKKMLSDDSLRFDEYDDKYVRVLIDCIKVNTDSTLTVIIKGGVPITVDIPT